MRSEGPVYVVPAADAWIQAKRRGQCIGPAEEHMPGACWSRVYADNAILF